MSDFRRRLVNRLENPEFAKAWAEVNEEIPHRKRSAKTTPKKSDHKHEYELVELNEWGISDWYTHIKICKICGKVSNQLRIEKI